ncbi:hypothetical protein NDU88_006456 [Pleurodeles waltl]|uniref:Uncharacterized protein n=1 Tax=Pleurodeles waltl TaxID=8319 RepID=A0AAV7N2F2_PLEWA|nr:hypothetical protein NDU88_006456 [Pleurodeles waltl]
MSSSWGGWEAGPKQRPPLSRPPALPSSTVSSSRSRARENATAGSTRNRFGTRSKTETAAVTSSGSAVFNRFFLALESTGERDSRQHTKYRIYRRITRTSV